MCSSDPVGVHGGAEVRALGIGVVRDARRGVAHWMPSSNKVRKVTSENDPTDAGREGELIFRLVYQQAGCKKPFSRLWLSSMEENAIREGFAHLKPSTGTS